MKMISVFSPVRILKLINFWPPYFFSGIRVVSVSSAVDEITVKKTSRFWNQNYFGTHFGGSLYAMCDPFFVFILLHKLKEDHIVWDIGAEIDFIKAVKGPVTATFKIEKQQVESLREQCLKSFKVEPWFSTEIKDSQGNLVAQVRKKLYVRRKDAKERFQQKPV